MKVLHIAETAKGGVGTIINSLMEMDSIESSVLVPDTQCEMILTGKKYLFNRTGRNAISLFKLALESFKLIKKNKPDVIHLHSTFSGMIVRFLYLIHILKKNDVTIVYTPHAFSFLMNVSESRKKIYSIIEKILTKVTDYIVCTSQYEMDTAILYGINKGKLKVIYNGVNVPIKDDESLKEDYPLSENAGKIKVLFLGRFDYQKGYDILLELIKILDVNKFEFDIIGDSVTGEAIILNKENVKYHGWLNHRQLNVFFKEADFLVMPSRWESFGLVAVEAQSYGLPVLANNCSSLPEVVDNNNTGILLDFSNIKAVASFISIKDKTFWNSKRRACIKFVEDTFLIEKMKLQYFSLYMNEFDYKEGRGSNGK
ncbi:TPA: glycosyltransferase [Klebsiella quasipneumoniae]|nr:glycosyltransferase [Klebsiella quasipneumoniae]